MFPAQNVTMGLTIYSNSKSSNGYATRIRNIRATDTSPRLLIHLNILAPMAAIYALCWSLWVRLSGLLARCLPRIRSQVRSCDALAGNFFLPWITHTNRASSILVFAIGKSQASLRAEGKEHNRHPTPEHHGPNSRPFNH